MTEIHQEMTWFTAGWSSSAAVEIGTEHCHQWEDKHKEDQKCQCTVCPPYVCINFKPSKDKNRPISVLSQLM